jgi:hypothetical protein
MHYQPGELVIVVDTTQRVIGSGEVQAYHPELHSYTVLFHYPGKPIPELIPLPAYRLLNYPDEQAVVHPDR